MSEDEMKELVYSNMENINKIINRIDKLEYQYIPDINERTCNLDNDIHRKINNEEFYDELYKLKIDIGLSTYFLLHKENYDKFFYSINELSNFIYEKIPFNNNNYHIYFNRDIFTIDYSYSSHKYTYNFEKYKEFLIKSIIADADYENEEDKFIYAINEEKFVKFIKAAIFNSIMTN